MVLRMKSVAVWSLFFGGLLLCPNPYGLHSGKAVGQERSNAVTDTGSITIESGRIEEALIAAGENRSELQKVLDQVPAERRLSAEFLIANMPPRDLKTLKSDFLLDEIRLAHESLEASVWKDKIPQEIFLNNILPYVNINERRDAWRKDFRERFLPLIADAKTPGQAAALLNQRLFPLVNVKYSTKRAKADQSPYESMQSGLASCTGLSVLLIDACRALAIPARFVGTPLWSDNSGNHSWIEVWDNGWHFTGAAEPSGDQLDQAWFIGRASTAKRDDRRHAIYAVSFQKTPLKFPMVWDPSIDYIHAVNVTDRYTNINQKIPEGTQMVSMRAIDKSKGERVIVKVRVSDANGDLASGSTKDESYDANDHLHYYLKEGGKYRIAFENGNESYAVVFDLGNKPKLITWEISSQEQADPIEPDELRELNAYYALPVETRGVLADKEFAKKPLTKEVAALVETRLVEEFKRSKREERKGEVEGRILEINGLKMPYYYKVFGDKPEGGRSLFISMHGGGGAPAAVNDGQYENQKRLYRPKEGVYLAPRAPTNTWNLWHEGHIDGFFDRLITDMVLFEDVDPDRVYLMGYSAGGDGVYQLAPRMADRFAAAAMMAGHPNETSPLGLRNLPFTLHMGEKDSAYKRNEIAESWKGLLGGLREKDPNGYEHFVKIHEGKGHWMDRQDAEALDWMTKYSRNRYPNKIVWKQDDVIGHRFYWLGTDGPIPDRSLTRVERDGQVIRIVESDLSKLSLFLSDTFIDCDREVQVYWGDAEVFNGIPQRTIASLSNTLEQRGDPKGMFSCRIDVHRPADGK